MTEGRADELEEDLRSAEGMGEPSVREIAQDAIEYAQKLEAVELEEVGFDGDELRARLGEHAGLKAIAAMCADHLEGAENYFEATLRDPNHDLPLIVTVRRMGKPTPHEKREEVEESRLAMSQAIYFALRCDQCDIGGEHEAMLDKHADVYRQAVSDGEEVPADV